MCVNLLEGSNKKSNLIGKKPAYITLPGESIFPSIGKRHISWLDACQLLANHKKLKRFLHRLSQNGFYAFPHFLPLSKKSPTFFRTVKAFLRDLLVFQFIKKKKGRCTARIHWLSPAEYPPFVILVEQPVVSYRFAEGSPRFVSVGGKPSGPFGLHVPLNIIGAITPAIHTDTRAVPVPSPNKTA